MNAQLVTLEGDSFAMTPHNMNGETMGGIMDWLRSTGSAISAPFVSPIKGTGHFVMEAGRGISTGDWGRIGASPFKGLGHTVGDFWRKETDMAEWYYRPSKMRQWMSPIGTSLLAAGAVPTPASPFLLAGGGLLSIGGAVGEGMYQKDRRKKADSDEIIRLDKAKRTNLMWTIAGVGLLGVGAYMVFK